MFQLLLSLSNRIGQVFGRDHYYLGGGNFGTEARILVLFGPFLLAIEEVLPDLFVRGAEEML